MKLRAKIWKKYLDKILKGEKKWEYRQIESIILECEGKEYEFEVLGIETLPPLIAKELFKQHNLSYDENLVTIAIRLGRKIR